MLTAVLASFLESPFPSHLGTVAAEMDWRYVFRPEILVFSVPIVTLVAYFWSETAKHRHNAELKQTMLDRGMSAHEIEQVINAGAHKPNKPAPTQSQRQA